MTPLFRRLAGLRRLRGTWADPFGYTAERREERALIAWYETLLDRAPPPAAPAPGPRSSPRPWTSAATARSRKPPSPA